MCHLTQHFGASLPLEKSIKDQLCNIMHVHLALSVTGLLDIFNISYNLYKKRGVQSVTLKSWGTRLLVLIRSYKLLHWMFYWGTPCVQPWLERILAPRPCSSVWISSSRRDWPPYRPVPHTGSPFSLLQSLDSTPCKRASSPSCRGQRSGGLTGLWRWRQIIYRERNLKI